MGRRQVPGHHVDGESGQGLQPLSSGLPRHHLPPDVHDLTIQSLPKQQLWSHSFLHIRGHDLTAAKHLGQAG